MITNRVRVPAQALFDELGNLMRGCFVNEFEKLRDDGRSPMMPNQLLVRLIKDNPKSQAALICNRKSISINRISSAYPVSAKCQEEGKEPNFSEALIYTMQNGILLANQKLEIGKITSGAYLLGLFYETGIASKDVIDSIIKDFNELVKGSTEEGATLLDTCGTDLTELAKMQKLDPVIGRNAELVQLMNILNRKHQNNPLLLGDTGVGKTALVERFAQLIISRRVPDNYLNVRIIDFSFTQMLQSGGMMAPPPSVMLKQLATEIKKVRAILFISEAQTQLGRIKDDLKPFMARGEIQVIAASTNIQAKNSVETDTALSRHFQILQIDEPTQEEAKNIVRGLAETFEKFHKVRILDSAISACVELSSRYLQDKRLPDKALSLMDTACARVAMSQVATPLDIEKEIDNVQALKLRENRLKKEKRLKTPLYKEHLKDVRKALRTTKEHLINLEDLWKTQKQHVKRLIVLLDADVVEEESFDTLRDKVRKFIKPMVSAMVTEDAVAEILSEWTGVPLGTMTTTAAEKVINLLSDMKKRVIGQDHALDAIAKRIRTSRAGLDNPNKPIGVFLLAGPSGVGKTETALALAEAMYGSERNVITLNMSEYQEAHTVSTIKGAPPGYIGYESGGVLTEAVRRKPYSVVLLDEIEKAHSDLHELFYQVFDKGVMDDSQGHSVDFKNTIILLTTNTGSAVIESLPLDTPIGQLKGAIREPLLKVFPAAFLGRLVQIPYYPLSGSVIRAITEIHIKKIADRVFKERRIPLKYSTSVIDLITAMCQDDKSGGRQIDNALNGTILPKISELFLVGEEVSEIQIGASNNEFTYEVKHG